MANWKDITKLDRDEKSREAAFEARMLAEVAADKSPASGPTTEATLSPTAPPQNTIRISVTEYGRTVHYDNLESVPANVKQHILNRWPSPARPSAPPIQSPPIIQQRTSSSSPRARSLRFAMMLNMLLPGAGQFYLGQLFMGTVYGLGFLASMGTMLVIFIRAYSSYLQLSTGGDIMEGTNLEQLAHSFPVGMLIALSVVGIAIYLVSSLHLVMSRPRE